MPDPTILINAFNRPAALNRLLAGLRRAHIPAGTALHISIDGGGDPDVIQSAQASPWPHGEKTVHPHPDNLGLVKHFLHCGGLTRELGDIIYLEDDLAVSRQFFHYAVQALAAYHDDPAIAGISLNRLPINGYTRHPFTPLPGAGDAFFAQVYWYQGQAYTARMWADFETWWHTERRPITPAEGLHPLFQPHARWQNDFFPDAMHYLQATGRFFAFPYESHTTQFGDPGTHFDRRTDLYQAPLQHERASYRFLPRAESAAVYDSYQEILPGTLAPALPDASFDVDLNGTKPPAALTKPYVLTTRPVRRAERTFGLRMRPAELNVLEGVPGDSISFARREDLRWDRLSGLHTAARLHAYHYPGQPGLSRLLLYRLLTRK